MYIVLRSPYLKIAVVHVSIPVTIFNRDSLDLLTILKKDIHAQKYIVACFTFTHYTLSLQKGKCNLQVLYFKDCLLQQ